MKKINYCWFICLGCALILFCTSGLSINAFTIYQPYILNQNHFTNTQSSSLLMIRSLFSFLAMFLTGKYYTLFSYRKGLCSAGFLAAFSFFCHGVSHSYPMYCISFAIMGLAYGFGTMIPITIILRNWFYERRTFAISLCSSITGLSTLGIPSLLTALIERTSLSTALFCEGTIMALLVLLAFLLIRTSPDECGCAPYGIQQQIQEEKHTGKEPVLHSRDWFLLVPMLLIIGAMMNTSYSHISVLMMSCGFSSQTIAIGIMLSGIAITCGKLLYGVFSERFSIYISNWCFGLLTFAGFVLMICNQSNFIIMYSGLICYGCGLAFTAVGLSAWCSELCSSSQYASTVKRFQLGYAAGCLIFASLPGILADRFSGSYKVSYILFAVFCLLILFIIQFMIRKQHQSGIK